MEEIKTYTTITKHEARIHEVEIQNGIPKLWNIRYSNSVSIPKALVKYYSSNEFGFSVLREHNIWATHPFDFNDPFDCSIQMWDIESFPYCEMKRVVEEFVFLGSSSNLNIFETRKIFFELVLRFIGIYCLNEKSKSDLFWGYYNNHKGFSIEFNTDIINIVFGNTPCKVEYKDFDIGDKISLNPKDLYNNELYTKVLRWITLKKDDWIHENEWRYLFMDIDLGNTNRKKAFPLNAITGIILGYKFFSEATNTKLLNRSTTEYIFNGDLEKNYTFKILNFLFENPEIKLKQVLLSEDFSLTEERIYIRKIKDNQVVVEIERE